MQRLHRRPQPTPAAHTTVSPSMPVRRRQHKINVKECLQHNTQIVGLGNEMYLLHHFLDVGRMAIADGEVAAGTAGVAEAREDDGTDHLLPLALQVCLWLVAVAGAFELAVLPRPRVNWCGVVLEHHGANGVPFHYHHLDVLGRPSLLLEHHHEVALRLQE